MLLPINYAIALLLLANTIEARCFDPSPAFPPPRHQAYSDSAKLKETFRLIAEELILLIRPSQYDTSSFSVEVTTSAQTLWTSHHTARVKDPSRPGAPNVDGNSVYRMASVTKAFTTLAIIQQHVAGNLSLDGTIDQYLPGLKGHISWKDITLRSVASQLSGVPRECTLHCAGQVVSANKG